MAKISYIQTPEGFDEKYFKNLKLGNPLGFSRMVKNTRFLSRERKLELKGRSLFTVFSVLWKTLDSAEKDAWATAAAEIGLNSWQLFVHDTASRFRQDIEGFSTPSTLHQGNFGWIHLDGESSGAVYGKASFGLSNFGDAEFSNDELKITQLHPKFYWIQTLISGHKRSWEPTQITEEFSLPVKIELSYRSELTPTRGDAFAKFYAGVWHSYQGVDRYTELSVDLDFDTDWKKAEATLENVLGHIISYDLYIHLKGLTGDLYFDNIKVEHSSQNWARDSRCDDVTKTLPRIWFLIPQRWVSVLVPDNAFFQSIYTEF